MSNKINFTMFISGLIAEGMISLGMLENPITKKKEKNLEHASSVIDVVEMLKEKTKGNLSKEESTAMDDALHQLRMVYVSMQSDGKKGEIEK